MTYDYFFVESDQHFHNHNLSISVWSINIQNTKKQTNKKTPFVISGEATNGSTFIN